MHNVQLVSVSVCVIIGKNGRQRWKFQNTFDSSICVVTKKYQYQDIKVFCIPVAHTPQCMLHVQRDYKQMKVGRLNLTDISQAY